MKTLKLSPERRERLVGELKKLFCSDFGMDISQFRAGEIIDRLAALIGPAAYNEAVEDVRAYFQRRLDDLDGEVFAEAPD